MKKLTAEESLNMERIIELSKSIDEHRDSCDCGAMDDPSLQITCICSSADYIALLKELKAEKKTLVESILNRKLKRTPV